MKTIKIAILCVLLGGTLATSAQKLGHINSNELIQAMPDRAMAEDSLQQHANRLEGMLQTMRSEYEAKATDFQAKQSTMTDIIRDSKIKEISDLEVRINEFAQNAQKELQEMEAKLIEPMVEAARKAIEEVAKENNYTYIFDSGVGALLYQKDSDDIMPMVKKKLGIQ